MKHLLHHIALGLGLLLLTVVTACATSAPPALSAEATALRFVQALQQEDTATLRELAVAGIALEIGLEQNRGVWRRHAEFLAGSPDEPVLVETTGDARSTTVIYRLNYPQGSVGVRVELREEAGTWSVLQWHTYRLFDD